MVIDRIEQWPRWATLGPDFAHAFAWLSAASANSVQPGKHVLVPDRLWIIVERGIGRGAAAPLEAHRRYADIQLVLEGTERIGWRARGDCKNISKRYEYDRDIEFYSDSPSTWVDLQPGEFAIFFPDDAHAPLAGATPVSKAIAKIAV